jgi:hypothetical protein
MRPRNEAIMNIGAALLVLFTAMIDPWISVALSATLLILLSLLKWFEVRRIASRR